MKDILWGSNSCFFFFLWSSLLFFLKILMMIVFHAESKRPSRNKIKRGSSSVLSKEIQLLLPLLEIYFSMRKPHTNILRKVIHFTYTTITTIINSLSLFHYLNHLLNSIPMQWTLASICCSLATPWMSNLATSFSCSRSQSWRIWFTVQRISFTSGKAVFDGRRCLGLVLLGSRRSSDLWRT